jgi:signal peptidase I
LKRQIGFLLCLFVLSTFSYFLVSRFLFATVVVQGQSMAPTLQDGEQYLLNRWRYHHSLPQRGDLVVLQDPGHEDYAVKRIIATPSDSVHLKGGAIFLNGKHLLEPYLPPGTKTVSSDSREQFFVVGADQYYVLGDNRCNSEDSRLYGPIPRSRIIGAISR